MVLTLGIPVEKGRALLGMKKRGFGSGRWNGFGGKVKDGETVAECLNRECREEASIEIKDCEKAGEFRFVFPDEVFDVHLFLIKSYQGKPSESEEMFPEWFEFERIPFDSMWPDDRIWFPYFLSGRKFKAVFEFLDHDRIKDWKITEVKRFPDA
ncbi:MAG: 8-oxo-dGTP diphosphatase [Candidatus Saccharibacteria bacterium]